MKIEIIPQHYIDWNAVGGYEKFIADYNSTYNYQQKRVLIDSLPLQNNPQWLEARRKHITASTMKDFLGNDRTGKKAGIGFKRVMQRYFSELCGWEEPELTWNEKSSVKRGLVFERRALELFKKETGLELDTNIGFISESVGDIDLGCSPDAYHTDENGKIDCLAEIKSFEMNRLQDELEKIHTPEICEQMQAQMFIADCPRCYKVLYCAELDKVFYLKYIRGLDFKKRLLERVELASEYIKNMNNIFQKYTDLTDKIMDE